MFKRVGQLGLLLIIYISIFIVLIIALIGSFFLFHHVKYETQFSNQRIERTFHRYETPFQVVVSFIQNVDVSIHQKESIDKPYIAIQKPYALPKDSIYKYSVITTSVDSIEITSHEINATLDDLFHNTDLISIRQTNATGSPSIYFVFSALAGVVFSPSGDAPLDLFDASMVYSYERINDYWFYWIGDWPD